jgi:hypothetical protein
MNRICSECPQLAVTDCDKCGKPTCRECAQIVVAKPTDLEVKIYHKGKCTPKKFRKE